MKNYKKLTTKKVKAFLKKHKIKQVDISKQYNILPQEVSRLLFGIDKPSSNVVKLMWSFYMENYLLKLQQETNQSKADVTVNEIVIDGTSYVLNNKLEKVEEGKKYPLNTELAKVSDADSTYKKE